MTLVDEFSLRGTDSTLTRRAEFHTILEQLGPILNARTEQQAWQHATALCTTLFAGDFAATIEFDGIDRARFRSTVGFSDEFSEHPFPVAPDAQATFIRESGEACRSGDIDADLRFTAPGFLTKVGVRSTLTTPFTLVTGGNGLLGVHSRSVDHFAEEDTSTIDVLGQTLASVIDRLRRQRHLEVRARTDAVTGLDNRTVILADLDHRIRTGQDVTVLLIDLDGFKSVNDQHGHRVGDRVLQTIATRIERSAGADERLGRLGGDEFLVLLSADTGTLRAEQLIGHVEEIIEVESRPISVSASIGISRNRADDDAASMLERADQMMYSAKAAGRGRVRADQVVQPVVEPASVPALPEIDTDLTVVESAIADLRVVVQPIVRASTGHLYGVEALARGGRDHVLESPERLFDAATTFGRLAELELAAKAGSFALDLPEDVTLFINLEPTLLCDPDWMRQLTDAWLSSGMRHRVVAELTEHDVMATPGRLLRAVDACRRLGWQIALDDVGSRSESLAALRWIEPDVIKLDMSLIRNENPAHSAHVVAAVAAYRNDPLRNDVIIIAEGVETLTDADHADVLGADLLQGYRYGHPGPVEDLALPDDVLVSPSRTRAVPHLGSRIASKRDLLSMSRHIEASALSADCIVLSTLQDVSHFTRRTQHQYRAMARRCGFVGVLGCDVSSVSRSNIAGVRVADITADDPIASTWQVIVMSAAVTIGMIATELEPDSDDQDDDDMNRLFSYRFISETRDVEHTARKLLRYF